MNKNLTITKTDKNFNDFKKHFRKEDLEEIDIIFINQKNSENKVHETLKNKFYEFLNEQEVKLDFIEYNNEKIITSDVFWDIGEFLVKDIVLSTTICLLFNFIHDSKMKLDENISLTIIVELKDKENIRIKYAGTINNFMNILLETNYFNNILNENVDWIDLFYDNYFKLYSKENNTKKYLLYKNFNLPSSLYQYTKVNYAKGLLQDNLMYLRRFDELNDPFDGSFLDDVKIEFHHDESIMHRNKAEREYLESQIIEKRRQDYLKIQNKYKKTYRVACFSQDNDSAPMWAFYGDEHKGICIEYNFHDEMKFRDFCFPIKYVNKTNNNAITKLLNEDIDPTNRLVQELFLKKYKSWNFEKEWRIVIQDEKVDHIFEPKWNDEKKFIDFLKPKAVYLGLKIEHDNRKYIKSLCKPVNIPVYQMIESTSGYRLIPKKII